MKSNNNFLAAVVTIVLLLTAGYFLFKKPQVIAPVQVSENANTENPSPNTPPPSITKEIEIRPLEVVEDSRCPIWAKCIWMGTVKLKVRVTNKAGEPREDILTLEEPKRIGGVVVTLTSVMPAKTDKVLSLSDYTFTFSTK